MKAVTKWILWLCIKSSKANLRLKHERPENLNAIDRHFSKKINPIKYLKKYKKLEWKN